MGTVERRAVAQVLYAHLADEGEIFPPAFIVEAFFKLINTRALAVAPYDGRVATLLMPVQKIKGSGKNGTFVTIVRSALE